MSKRILASILALFLCVQPARSDTSSITYTAADIPVLDGKVYHLSLSPEQFAPNIIIVGDPDRVPLLAAHCLKQEGRIDVCHRGLRTITGTTESGLRLTIVTSGMGTASTEIVLNELIILNEIDVQTRIRRQAPIYKTLNIIRLGTSGSLQATTELGSLVITEYAVGMDNTGLFYDAPIVNENVLKLENMCKEKLEQAIDKNSRFYHAICPYASAASSEIVSALYDAALIEKAQVIKGITISNAGFFANQGRDVSRINMTIPNLDKIFTDISINGTRVENMEMEASFICHFAGSLGYRIGAICPVVCNRRLNTFFNGSYEENVLTALKIILRAFETLNSIDKNPRRE